MEPPVWKEPTPSRATVHPATPGAAVKSVCPTSSINSVCYRSHRFSTENATAEEISSIYDLPLNTRLVRENKSAHEYFILR